jgi:hypothetical protein
MRLPRYRLRTLMLAVAAVAVVLGPCRSFAVAVADFGERLGLHGSAWLWVAIMLMPTAMIVAVTLYDVGDEAWRDLREWRSRPTKPR